VIVHAIPAAFTVTSAREMVGRPFLRDLERTDLLKKAQGPLHLIACHRGATETQARAMLGFPDAIVVSDLFGIYVADEVQKVQFAFLAIDFQHVVEMMLFPGHNRYVMPAPNRLALDSTWARMGTTASCGRPGGAKPKTAFRIIYKQRTLRAFRSIRGLQYRRGKAFNQIAEQPGRAECRALEMSCAERLLVAHRLPMLAERPVSLV